ncbi:MAG TPA: hypothetical protein VGB52_00875 [Actinomycetota bacterium]
MLIEQVLPVYDVIEHHRAHVRAAPAGVWAAVLASDLRRSWVIRTLLAARGMIGGGDSTVAGFERLGFERLAEAPGEELVLGLVGKPWLPRPAVRRGVDFEAFDQPGYVRIAWGWRVEADGDGSLLSTETRVQATDARARLLFRAYWTVIGRFSGLIRSEALALIKREAERRRP